MKPGLVILLGAGASFPGMCSVAELTDFLVGWPDRREPVDGLSVDDPLYDVATVSMGPEDARPPFFRALLDVAATAYRDRGSLDFEQLIHLAEQLGTFFPLPQSSAWAD